MPGSELVIQSSQQLKRIDSGQVRIEKLSHAVRFQTVSWLYKNTSIC